MAVSASQEAAFTGATLGVPMGSFSLFRALYLGSLGHCHSVESLVTPQD